MIQVCSRCKKEIDTKKDKYVLLGTYNGTGNAKEHEVFYHFQCWIDNFNEQIVNRIRKGQDQAMKMLGGMLEKMNVKVN